MKSGLKGKFYGEVITSYVDGNIWRLHQEHEETFGIDIEGIGRIQPADGFYFDFASIPPPVRWFFPKTGDGKHGAYGPAAVIHDWLYSFPGVEGKNVDRRTVDRIFLLGMELMCVAPGMRSLFYIAVRIGGGLYFGKPDKLNRLRTTL